MFCYNILSRICNCSCFHRPRDIGRRSLMRKNGEGDNEDETFEIINNSDYVHLLVESDEPEDAISQSDDSEYIEKIQSLFNESASSQGNYTNNQGKSDDVEKLYKRVMKILPTDRSRVEVLNTVFADTVKRFVGRHETQIPFWRFVIKALDKNEQKELAKILADLPSAVMGDIIAQDTSRVLVNIKDDVREAVETRPRSNFIILNESVSDLLNETLQERGNIEQSICGMLQSVSPWERFRCIMSHMLLSPVLPHSQTERLTIIESIFGEVLKSKQLEGGSSDSDEDELSESER